MRNITVPTHATQNAHALRRLPSRWQAMRGCAAKSRVFVARQLFLRGCMYRLALVLLLVACEGPAGPPGPGGPSGTDGTDGTDGSNGSNGEAISPWNTSGGVDITISDLSVAAGGATVKFKLTDNTGVALDRTGKLTQ